MKYVSTISTSLALLALCSGSAYAANCSGDSNDAPIPNVAVQTPSSDVPEGISKFLGVWGNAAWDGELCHVLTVVSVDGSGNADVRYSYGTSTEWYIDSPGTRELTGNIRDGVLTLRWSTSRGSKHVTYEFNSDGHLEGIYRIDSGDYYTEPHLSKIR